MAYSTSLNMVVGDTLPELVVTLKFKYRCDRKSLDADDSSTWAPIVLLVQRSFAFERDRQNYH